jgi:hypothetical protein
VWFVVIRAVTFLPPIIFLLARHKRKKGARKIINTGAIILCILLWCGSSQIPIENLLYSFPSAEAAFRYCKTGNIIDVIPGVDSSMVIYTTGIDNNLKFYFTPHIAGKYKIDMARVSYLLFHKLEYGNVLSVYHFPDSRDYYLFIMSFPPNSCLEISDDYGSTFKEVVVDRPSQQYAAYYYFTNIQNIQDGYNIIIDDTRICVNIT